MRIRIGKSIRRNLIRKRCVLRSNNIRNEVGDRRRIIYIGNRQIKGVGYGHPLDVRDLHFEVQCANIGITWNSAERAVVWIKCKPRWKRGTICPRRGVEQGIADISIQECISGDLKAERLIFRGCHIGNWRAQNRRVINGSGTRNALYECRVPNYAIREVYLLNLICNTFKPVFDSQSILSVINAQSQIITILDKCDFAWIHASVNLHDICRARNG